MLLKTAKLILFNVIFLNGIGQSFTLTNLIPNYTEPNHFCDSTVEMTISPTSIPTSNLKDVNLRFTGTALNNRVYNVTINWGDNTTTTHTGTAISDGTPIVWAPSLIHTYTTNGKHNISTTIEDDSTGTTDITGWNVYTEACQVLMDFTVNYDCDLDGTLDSTISYFPNYPNFRPFFIENGTDTIYPSYYDYTNNEYLWPNGITAGTYNISTTPSLSAAYGFTLDTIYSSTITLPLSVTPSITATLGCANACVQGAVFCDDNLNGILDNNESSISGVPVTLGISGIPNSTILTDANGDYSTTWSFSKYSQVSFTPSQTWLDSMGYINPQTNIINSYYNQNNFDCNSPTNYNIPIICNATAADSICFDGVTFHDINNNGVQDTNEAIIPNVTLQLYINNQYITWFNSDNNGYYSYGDYNPNVDTIEIHVLNSWLTSNNYTASINHIMNFQCDSIHTNNIPLHSTTNFSFGSTFTHDAFTTGLCDSVKIGIAPDNYDNVNYSDIKTYFTGSNMTPNTSLNATVIWGDGSTTNHTGIISNSNVNIQWQPSMSHLYLNPGTYAAQITLLEPLTQSTISQTVDSIHVINCMTNVLNPIIHYDCNGDGVIDSVANIAILPNNLELSNINNTYTALSYDPISGEYAWDSLANGVYNVNLLGHINNVYGSANNGAGYDHILSTTPSTITIPNTGTMPDVIFTLGCADTLTGYLFCDDDQDGYLDSFENTIPNAPLIVTNSNGPTTVSTDALGQYQYIGNGLFSDPSFTLAIDTNYLISNGYTANQTLFNSPVYYFPIICSPPTSTDSICISGQVFCDSDNDGILDSNETIIPNAPITIVPFNNSGYYATMTDSLGNYIYHNLHPNIDSVEVSISNAWLAYNGYDPMTPIALSTLDCSVSTNIGIDCNIPQPCDNTWINIFGAGPYYQNWTNSMSLSFGNSDYLFPGSIYTISVDFPSGSTFNPSGFPMAYTVTGNTVSWTQTINNFDTLTLNFDVAAGISDSTSHLYTTNISGPNLDCDSTNNTNNYTSIVGASYDPNNKLVNQPEFINPSIQEAFIYRVNFQNTGTAPAQDIYIEDALSQHLDWTSLNIISHSHQMQYTLDATGNLTFFFPQIWLPDSTSNEPLSHGYVTYTIKENMTVPLNQPIENTAYIYFDQNPAIVTNTTVNTNVTLSVEAANNTAEIKLYPNPTTGYVNILSNEQIRAIQVYDLTGKLVFEGHDFFFQASLDLSSLTKGVYQVKTTTENGTETRKLILN